MNVKTPPIEPDKIREPNPVESEHGGVLKPAVQVTLLSLGNIGAGLVVQMILAAHFGAAMEMDAYLAATTIPLTITAILLGTLNITFVPIFTQFRAQTGQAEAWKVASSFTVLTTLILTAIALTGIVGAESLLRFTVPGFTPGSPQSLLAVQMSRILFCSIIFIGLSALFSSISYAERKFLRPAAAPVVNNLIIILFTIGLSSWMGIQAVAWATLAGAVAQLLLLLPVVWGSGRFVAAVDFRHPGVQQVFQVMWPLLLGGLIFRSTAIADRFVASLLPVGSISHLGYSLKIVYILWALTSSGIVIALFPLQSEQAARAKEGLGRVTSLGLRLSIVTTMGVGICFLLFRQEIIRLFFERGAFDARATEATATLLLFYAGALLIPAMSGSITYALYALQQTKVTTVVAISGALLNYALLIPFSRWLGVNGVALAFSVASISNAMIMGWLLVFRFKVPLHKEVLNTLVNTIGAALVAGLSVLAVSYLFRPISVTSLEIGLWLSARISVFILTYTLVLLFRGAPELRMIVDHVQVKVQRLFL
jgi:putative peptidoglycan lipid II flippase